MARHWADFLAHLTRERVKYETVRLWMGIDWCDREWTDERYRGLVKLAAQEPEAYWVARRQAADYLLLGEAMPEILSDFAQEVLLGNFRKPKTPGRPASAEDWKLALLYHFTSELISKPFIRRFRAMEAKTKKDQRGEEIPRQDTACDIMADALSEVNAPKELGLGMIEARYLNDLCKKKQYEPIRALADRLKPRQL